MHVTYIHSKQFKKGVAMKKILEPRTWPTLTPEAIVRIRRDMRLSRSAFCDRFGFDPAAFLYWELGTKIPGTDATLILHLIRMHPEILSLMVAKLKA